MVVKFCKIFFVPCGLDYNCFMNKIELRKYAKKFRRELDIEALSVEIVEQISLLEEFQAAQNVLFFYPKGAELNMLSLCTTGKNFYLPRVEGETLFVCPYDCNTELRLSEFNVQEPCSAPVDVQLIDFAIIPCLMADKNGFRLGYGGGFYDRFIPSLREDCVKVVPVASSLVSESLPVDDFDIPVDMVITEKGLVGRY